MNNLHCDDCSLKYTPYSLLLASCSTLTPDGYLSR